MIVNQSIPSKLLSTVYQDRFVKTSELMNMFPNSEYLSQCKLKEGERDPAVKFNYQLMDHEYLNLAFDVQVVDHKNGPYSSADAINMEYVYRKKIYISDKNIMKYNNSSEKNAVYEYFISLKKDFDPVMREYYDSKYLGIRDEYKFKTTLMLIEYACPFATDENRIEMRNFNTKVWGKSHCDETLGGIHFGEDVQEFRYSTNGAIGPYDYSDGLMKDEYMFFYGEEAKRFGHTPTYHQMFPHPTEPSSTRYSIIMDLEI